MTKPSSSKKTTSKLLIRLVQLMEVNVPGLTPEEKEFVHFWVDRHFAYYSLASVYIAMVVIGLSTIPIYLLAPNPPRNIQIITHGLMALMLGMWIIGFKKGEQRNWLFVSTALTCITGYSFAIHEVFMRTPTVKDGVILSSIYAAVMTFSVILFPYPGRWVLLTAAYYLGFAAYIFESDFFGIGAPWLATVVVQIGFSLTVFYGRLKRIQKEGLQEFKTRELLKANEKLKRESIEKDISLAREIQDSFSPPQALRYSDVRIDFFQRKHDLLGGDWYAMKKSPNGDLTILVADATGKSIGAALVIHAVQSLWALSLDDPDFDPLKWIRGVNKSLYALGQKSPHSLTLALAHLKGSQLTYYSAGHVPLVIVREEQGEKSLRFIQARGEILGLHPQIRLTPAIVDLHKEHVKTILFATDGIIDKGSRTNRQFLTDLLLKLDATGEKALEDCPAEDDKLLVRLELAA